MNIFLDREVRRLFWAVGLLLLAGVLAGQALAQWAAVEYKSMLVEHDAALAGALLEQGLDPASAAAVFTADKTEAQRQAGADLLAHAGVSESVSYRLLPEAGGFALRSSLAALGAGLVFSAALLVGLYRFALRRERRTVQAAGVVEAFVRDGGNQGHRPARSETGQGGFLLLDDTAEGGWGQFTSALNGMAASLTTHLQKEQRDREFLKDTISDISHQLKTPLSALKMYLEIMREEQAVNPVIVDFLGKSERELGRMEYLIQNLLKLARLDAGAIALEKRPLQMAAFLRDTLEGLSVRAEVEGKRLDVACPEGLTLEGDELWLAEAVSNLVKNGLDHAPAGGRVQVICEETPLVVSILVQDNGAGIRPEDLPYVFKRFYRSRFSQDHQGAGIGLTLAHSIIEKHGGSIVVESEPGSGATFRVIFPKLSNL